MHSLPDIGYDSVHQLKKRREDLGVWNANVCMSFSHKKYQLASYEGYVEPDQDCL